MLADGKKLRTFGETVTRARYELYIPGELQTERELQPDVMQESEERKAPMPEYEPGWTIPKRVPVFESPELKRYKTGKTLREWGKEMIFERLAIIPAPIPFRSSTIPGEGEIKQLPHFFVDGVPSFEAIPFSWGNQFGQAPEGATRGWWGELISSLSTGATKFFELQKAKYEAELEALKQPQQAALIPSSAIPDITKSSMFPLLLAGGVILLILGTRKKRQRR